MKNKYFFAVTAAAETATGAALLATPSLLVSALLGASLETPVASSVARILGAALVAIGIACWLASGDGESRAARGLISAMLFYNAAAAVLLIYSGTVAGLAGIGLWPAALLHAVLVIWSVACLRQNR